MKADSDLRDIAFLIQWLQKRHLKISIAAYNAAKPERLYEALKVYAKYLEGRGLTSALNLLGQVLTASDMEQIG